LVLHRAAGSGDCSKCSNFLASWNFCEIPTSAICAVFRQVRKSCHSDVGKAATVAPFPAAAPGIKGVKSPTQGLKPRVRQKGSPVPSHQWNPFLQFKTKTATSQSNHRENGVPSHQVVRLDSDHLPARRPSFFLKVVLGRVA